MVTLLEGVLEGTRHQSSKVKRLSNMKITKSIFQDGWSQSNNRSRYYVTLISILWIEGSIKPMELQAKVLKYSWLSLCFHSHHSVLNKTLCSLFQTLMTRTITSCIVASSRNVENLPSHEHTFTRLQWKHQAIFLDNNCFCRKMLKKCVLLTLYILLNNVRCTKIYYFSIPRHRFLISATVGWWS